MDYQCRQISGDIAGPGVRLSFYLQNFILVLLVDRSYADAENALWTFIATSFGLTVAALVQVKYGSLSLLEGILVSQLSWFANIGTFLSLASYSRSKGDDNVVKVAAVLQGYFSMILTVVMWVFADRFQPHCDFKFVFLINCTLPALGSGRTVALIFAAFTILVYTSVTFVECRAWQKHGRSHIRMRETDVELAAKTHDDEHRERSGSTYTRHARSASLISNSRKKRRPPKRTKWLKTDVDPIFFGIMVSQVIVLTYFISTTELIISGNDGTSGPDAFGFGQVLALAVLIPSLISLYRAIQKNRIAKPQLENQSPEEEKSRKHECPSPSTVQQNLRGLSGPLSPPPHLRITLPEEQSEHLCSASEAHPAVEGTSSVCSISTAN